MSLSHQDVQALLKLLDDSAYDELNLSTDAFTLQLRRSDDGKSWQQASAAPAAAVAAHANIPTASAGPAVEPPASEPGLIDVRAPMVGTWYRAPKPGADPFIATGSQVQEDSVIGIIEVMKLMSSIPARATGRVVEILAEDASFVEKGQLLLRVKPGQA